MYDNAAFYLLNHLCSYFWTLCVQGFRQLMGDSVAYVYILRVDFQSASGSLCFGYDFCWNPSEAPLAAADSTKKSHWCANSLGERYVYIDTRWVARNSLSTTASISEQPSWLYLYWCVGKAFHTPPCAVILLQGKASKNGTNCDLVAD